LEILEQPGDRVVDDFREPDGERRDLAIFHGARHGDGIGDEEPDRGGGNDRRAGADEHTDTRHAIESAVGLAGMDAVWHKTSTSNVRPRCAGEGAGSMPGVARDGGNIEGSTPPVSEGGHSTARAAGPQDPRGRGPAVTLQ